MDNVNVKLLKELTRGIESASQLRALISDQSQTKNQLRNNNEKLIACLKHQSSNILSSFDNAISILKHTTQLKYSYNSCKIRHSNKRSYPSTRNINSKPVKIVNSHVLEYDGYTWRKYGQKPIVNDKHPREYYRCGYKNEGCYAIKHVQVTSENPIKYKTTYFGQHTCHSIIQNKVSHFDLLDYTDQKEYHSTNILSFEPPSEPKEESVQIKKKPKEIEKEKTHSGCNDDMPSSSSSDSFDQELMNMECLFSPQWVENNYGSVDQVDGGIQDFQIWE